VFLHFQLELRKVRYFSVPTSENLKDSGHAIVGAVHRSVFLEIYEFFPPCFGVGISSEFCEIILCALCKDAFHQQ
jgi:hypothetical protein